MKKTLVMLISVVLVVGVVLSGCGKKEKFRNYRQLRMQGL